jgi:DNA-binding SARP family transcriptional activator
MAPVTNSTSGTVRREPPPLPVNELRLLHGFQLRHDNVAVTVPTNVQRLLAFLALRSRPQHRTTLAGCLWVDSTEERAAANMRTALWRARRIDGDLVSVRGSYVQIGSEVRVDLHEMMNAARHLAEPGGGGQTEATPDQFADDLLPEWYDDWVLLERERLRQLRLHSLEALCVQLTRAGRLALAIDAGVTAVACEPLRESAQRVLIEAHLAEGNVSEAVRQYDSYRALLRESLRIEPSTALRDLVRPCR